MHNVTEKDKALLSCLYTVWCYDKNGKLKWVDGFQNLVTTAGLNALLDNTFNAAAGSVAWYVGLKGTGTPVAGDTMASHASWATITPYSNATDPAWTKNGAAGSGAMSNSSSKASFTINAGTTVYGSFLKSNNTKGGTTGTLYGVGDFSSPRVVANTDLFECASGYLSRGGITMAIRPTSFPELINEQSTALYEAVLKDERAVPIGSGRLDALTLTLCNVVGNEAIINGRDGQNVLNQNNVTVDASGNLAFELQSADTAIQDAAVKSEIHRAIFRATYDGGKAMNWDVDFKIRNLSKVS